MVITYTDEKKFTKEQIQRLFLSVGWVSGQYPERLHKALMGSSTVFSAWDGERLVGLVRVLDDTEMVAYMHYVLVDPEYQGAALPDILSAWSSSGTTITCISRLCLRKARMPRSMRSMDSILWRMASPCRYAIRENGTDGTGIGHVLRTSGGEGRHLSPEAFPLPLIFFGVRLSDLE